MSLIAKMEGEARLRQRMRALVGPTSERAMLTANQRSAAEFQATVRSAIPVGDAERGNLVNTMAERTISTTGVEVSIGGPENPYPLHLEVGHRARDGSHVPGLAFWFPAKQVTKKRAKGRIVRAERAAIKAVVSR